MLGTKPKRPGDGLDYDVDASKWIPPGDTVVSVTGVSNNPTELMITAIQISGNIIKFWLAGGIAGKTYVIDFVLGTTAGRTKTEQFEIRVRN